MVLLDPDLYFPNRFCFEPTPETGVLLMWQRPCCLLPAETVRSGMEQGIRFAHHVDIGVGAWRAHVDLEWLDWLIGRLNVQQHSRVMHIEAIIWAALAMHIGGGYLDPNLWQCWRFHQHRRVLLKVGVPGVKLLGAESFSKLKCFHAGGHAKYWLAEAQQNGLLDGGQTHISPGQILPYEELIPSDFYREQRAKDILRRLGYYSLFRQY
jgi:hypothetical protein